MSRQVDVRLPEPQAERDLTEAVLWLRDHASARVGLDFVDAVEDGIELRSRHPLAGSAWVGPRLGIPELRSFPSSRTGYLLFYLATDRGVELVRVLHGRQDIDATLIEWESALRLARLAGSEPELEAVPRRRTPDG